MKAIYLNIDPYLQAVADWLNAGKPGPAPSFSPLPVAVTIPLGESAVVYLNNATTDAEENDADTATIDGQTVYLCVYPDGGIAMPEGEVVALGVVPGLSAVAPSAKYAVVPWAAWESENGAKVEFWIGEENDPATAIHVTIPVLVRRETASGPVDLVDFTPPAAPSAADIKSALVAAGDGALAGVNLGGAILVTLGDGMQVSDATQIGETGPLVQGSDVDTALGIGSASA